MVDVSYRWRKPLLLMYNDNYRYGTNLYVPVVNSLDHRTTRDYPIIPQYIPTGLAPLPKVPLAQYDLYAPVSYGYGRNLLKPRTPEVPHRSRISSRYLNIGGGSCPSAITNTNHHKSDLPRLLEALEMECSE